MEKAIKSSISNEIWIWKQLKLDYDIAARYGHRMIEVNNMILMLFGSSSQILRSDLHVYDCKSKKWFQPIQKGTIPCARASFSIAAIGTKVIIFGGYVGETFLLTKDMYELETTTWEWQEVRPISSVPSERLGASFTTVDNKIYMFGGLTTNNMEASGSFIKYHNELYVLSKLQDKYVWEIVMPLGVVPSERESHSAVAYRAPGKNWLIIYGGTYKNKRLDDIWIFDIESMEWRKPIISGTPPEGRSLHSCNIIGSKMIVYGGCVEVPSSNNIPDWRSTSSMGCLNLETMTWETENIICGYQKPMKRDCHQTVVVDNEIYLFSGRCCTGKVFHPNYMCYNDFWKLEIKDASEMFRKPIPDKKEVPETVAKPEVQPSKLDLPRVYIIPNNAQVNHRVVRTPGGIPVPVVPYCPENRNVGGFGNLLTKGLPKRQILIQDVPLDNKGDTQNIPNSPSVQTSGCPTLKLTIGNKQPVNNQSGKVNVTKNGQPNPPQFIPVPTPVVHGNPNNNDRRTIFLIKDNTTELPRMTVNISNQESGSKQYYYVVPKTQTQPTITQPIPVKIVTSNVMNLRPAQNIPDDLNKMKSMLVQKKNSNITETISSSVISSTQGSATNEMTATIKDLLPKNTPDNVLNIMEIKTELDDIENSISSNKIDKLDAGQPNTDQMNNSSSSSSSTTLSMHDNNEDDLDINTKEEDTQNDNLPAKKIKLEINCLQVLDKPRNLNAIECVNGINLSWVDPPNLNGKVVYHVFIFIELFSGFLQIYSGSARSCIISNEALGQKLNNVSYIYIKIVPENEMGRGEALFAKYTTLKLGSRANNVEIMN